MLNLDVPDTKYKSVEETVFKSSIVLRRVFQDKVWSVINSQHFGDEEYSFGGESTHIKSRMFQNPFSFPNTYNMELFGETIERTDIQTPIFRITKSFLDKVSVRHNYRMIIESYINDLLNDGLRNPYTYASAIVYFLEMCNQWNLLVNRCNPEAFTERQNYLENLIRTYCHDITSMAVQVSMMCNDRSGETYDLDTLLQDELSVLDNTICDALWSMRIGQDVCPLEGGLGEDYEYFEDITNEK